MSLVFFDFEASSLKAGSFPIEVAWVAADLSRADTCFIQPAPSWPMTEWDQESQTVHGISYQQLLAQGRPCRDIAETLNCDLAGATLISNAGHHDFGWLAKLYLAAGARPAFDVLPPHPSPDQYDHMMSAWRDASARLDYWVQVTALQRSRAVKPAAHEVEWEDLKKEVGLIEHVALHDAVDLALGFHAVEILAAPEDRRQPLRDDVVARAKLLIDAHAMAWLRMPIGK